MDVFESIFSRRSVRSFANRDVEDEKLEKVLEAARWAPSWANTQCFRSVVVGDQEKKEKIADTLSKKNPAKNAVRKAPYVIASCAVEKVSGYKDGKPVTDKEDWFMFDVALALQNLMLAAHSEGLGTVQVGAFDSKQVEDILKVPDNVSVVTIIPIGYPDKEPEKISRKNLEEIVFENEFGNSFKD